MKISFDLDGTLYRHKALQEMFLQLQQQNDVGILTGHIDTRQKEDLAKLKEMGIEPDFHIGSPNGFDNEQESSKWKKQMLTNYSMA